MTTRIFERKFDICPSEAYTFEFEDLKKVFEIPSSKESRYRSIFYPYLSRPICLPRIMRKRDLGENTKLYTFKFEDLDGIFSISEKEKDERLKLFSRLHPFISHTFYQPKKVKEQEVQLTKTLKRRFSALFRKRNEYRYFNLEIKPSTIPKSGMGVFALETIPKGWRVQYVGVPIKGDGCNPYYSFTVHPFGKITGNPNHDRDAYMYIDSTKEDLSNWTRTINCDKDEKKNNFEPVQIYDQIWCVAKKEIATGEELFLWYGQDYVDDHFS